MRTVVQEGYVLQILAIFSIIQQEQNGLTVPHNMLWTNGPALLVLQFDVGPV